VLVRTVGQLIQDPVFGVQAAFQIALVAMLGSFQILLVALAIFPEDLLQELEPLA